MPDEQPDPGDLDELGRLFKAHEEQLLAMLRRRITPGLTARFDAGELLNEAFLAARRKWAGFQRQTELSSYAWLYRISLDCLIEAWRKQSRGRRDPAREMPWPEHSSVQLGLGLLDPGTSPSSAAARDEQCARMRQTLELLAPTDREVLWMRHYDELAFKEIAAVLAIGESAATLRYVRALKRLRQLWEQLHGSGDCHG